MTPLWQTPHRMAILDGIRSSSGCSLGDSCRADGDTGCGMIERLSNDLVAQLGLPAGVAWVAKAALAIPRILDSWTPADRLHVPAEAEKSLIRDWQATDRDERAIKRRMAHRHMHSLPPPPQRWHKDNPTAVYKVMGVGVDAFTQHRCAKVALTGLPVVLWVDLHGVPLSVGRNAWKRQVRHGGTVELPKEAHDRIRSALRPYLG